MERQHLDTLMTFHGRKVVAPLKPPKTRQIGQSLSPFHGRKVVAPLKHAMDYVMKGADPNPSTAARSWPH